MSTFPAGPASLAGWSSRLRLVGGTRSRLLGVLIGLVCASMWTAAAPAASSPSPPPANDKREKALVVTKLPATLVGTTVGATREATDPRCGAPMVGTVWYGFSRSRPGTVEVSLQSGGQLDAVVAVYQVVNEQLKLLRCQVTDSKARARFVFETHPRRKQTNEFLLLVGQRVNSDPGTFRFSVTAPERPGNDELAGATAIASLPATLKGSTVGATRDVGDPSCAYGGGTVWYRLQAGARGRAVVGLQAGADLEAELCVVEKVRSQLRYIADQPTDDRGRSSIDFERKAGSRVYLVVSQTPSSDPGPFTLTVTGLPRPSNDEMKAAASISALPATLDGTTIGATRDTTDPNCIEGENTVWYRLQRPADGRLLVYLQSGGKRLNAAACVVETVQAKLHSVTSRFVTGKKGDASFGFEAKERSTYFVVVSEAARSRPGPFTLTVAAPEKPPLPPGEALATKKGWGRLDALQNPADAWAVKLDRGKTYRFGVFTTPGRCVSAYIFAPGTKSFEDDAPVAESNCGAMQSFTPGPDGGGTYSVYVEVGNKATAYHVFVRSAQLDDIGPGIALGNGARRSDSVSRADPLDLYRLDIVSRSDVRVVVDAAKDLRVRLLDGAGGGIQAGERGVELVRTLSPGTYFVAVRAGETTAKYRIQARIRRLTTTSLTVNGASSARIKPSDVVSLRTTTDPTPEAGFTRVQADYFDVVGRTWVFRTSWDVRPGSTISFRPDAVGQWRLRASFNGSYNSSPSRTDYRTIAVAPLTAPAI